MMERNLLFQVWKHAKKKSWMKSHDIHQNAREAWHGRISC